MSEGELKAKIGFLRLDNDQTNEVYDVLDEAKQDFPKSKVWEQFMREMFNKDGSYKADVWYDILDEKDVGEILDWIIEFMKKFEKWFGEQKR